MEMSRDNPIVFQPPSTLHDLSLLLAICFCFTLIILAIYFATKGDFQPAAISLIGAVLFVPVISAIKGVRR